MVNGQRLVSRDSLLVPLDELLAVGHLNTPVKRKPRKAITNMSVPYVTRLWAIRTSR